LANSAYGKTINRLFFVDHLRATPTILVVLHHISVVYGANPPFYYMKREFQVTLAYLLLVIFQLINHAFFMGFFFLHGRIFRPQETIVFPERLLAIPTLIFMFMLSPIAFIGAYQMPAEIDRNHDALHVAGVPQVDRDWAGTLRQLSWALIKWG
jgi:hypothetical protein